MSNPHLPSPSSDTEEDEFNTLSSTPTPFSHLHRSLSYGATRSPSASDSQTPTPLHHHQGTSYFSRGPTSSRSRQQQQQQPTPILMRSSSAHSTSTRRNMRSTSVSSRGFARDDEVLSEADEERDGGEAANPDTAAAPNDDEDDVEADADAASDIATDVSEDPITLKARQSLINVQHPFGLPIWKPALYKKSRSVTRYADEALHSIPSAEVERHLVLGNLFWVAVFGWWMAVVLGIGAGLMGVVEGLMWLVSGRKERKAGGYASLVFGLAWYIAWPFGKYVEGVADEVDDDFEEDDGEDVDEHGSNHTVRGHQQSTSWIPVSENTSLAATAAPTKSYGTLSSSSSPSSLGKSQPSSSSSPSPNTNIITTATFYLIFLTLVAPLLLTVSLICWGLVLTIPMAKLNWALIRVMWEQGGSGTMRFCAAPTLEELENAEREREQQEQEQGLPLDGDLEAGAESRARTIPSASASKTQQSQQQPQFTGKPRVVLLCTYRALGLKYYKYTIGGVNIMFVNLLFVVFFAIFDWGVLLSWVEDLEEQHRPVPPVLQAVASQGVIFLLSLLSVIPLSYFIGMAVASISAQSSIGMGAVINATFGSIIEILLYSIALVKGKGKLVEGSVVGSLLAGVGLMPGMSMVSSALRRKETRFNAGSAGVTSVMLIMAIVGALTPTLFYQTYGNFQLICTGCPDDPDHTSTLNKPWICDQCFYQHPDPVQDPFYQSTVKSLMFFCAAVLIFSYLVGLWFSLRTHASQIWQNPQQLLNPMDLNASTHSAHTLPLHHSLNTNPNAIGGVGGVGPNRMSLYKYMPTPAANAVRTLSRRASTIGAGLIGGGGGGGKQQNSRSPTSPTFHRRVSYAPVPVTGHGHATSTAAAGGGTPSITIPASAAVTPGGTVLPSHSLSGSGSGYTPVTGAGFTPLLESVDQAVKAQTSTMPSLQLPESVAAGTGTGTNANTGTGTGSGSETTQSQTQAQPGTLNVTTDDFTRAVAVATVSALRHQQQAQAQALRHGYAHSPARPRSSGVLVPGEHVAHADGGGHGGHDAPSWSRFTSASVLLGCTALYAVIAEILIDVIDVILGDSGLDEKFLGVTLLALVPNTTEFMNAISFALNGNIALSMEIGSAYALQVCLLQIPAMVAFSAWWFPDKMGETAHTFSLIFPRWDVIAIILSIFLLSYTYIEAKSNYHRGSILILSYLVLIAGFYYAPRTEDIHPEIDPLGLNLTAEKTMQRFDSLTFWEYARWWVTAW